MIPLISQVQLYTIQNLQRSLFSQTSSCSGTFFAVSYSRPALVSNLRPEQVIFLPFFFSFFNPSYKSFVTKLTKFLEWIKIFGHLSEIINQYTLKNHLGPDQNILEITVFIYLLSGEALQSYSVGEELLTVELGKADNNPHHALDILDFFQVSLTTYLISN